MQAPYVCYARVFCAVRHRHRRSVHKRLEWKDSLSNLAAPYGEMFLMYIGIPYVVSCQTIKWRDCRKCELMPAPPTRLNLQNSSEDLLNEANLTIQPTAKLVNQPTTFVMLEAKVGLIRFTIALICCPGPTWQGSLELTRNGLHTQFANLLPSFGICFSNSPCTISKFIPQVRGSIDLGNLGERARPD